MSDYRTGYCSQCLELSALLEEVTQKNIEFQKEIDRVKNFTKVFPFQPLNENNICVSCGCRTLSSTQQKGYFTKDSSEDIKYCNGKGLFSRCPKFPHIHRYCRWCFAKWLEETKLK